MGLLSILRKVSRSNRKSKFSVPKNKRWKKSYGGYFYTPHGGKRKGWYEDSRGGGK